MIIYTLLKEDHKKAKDLLRKLTEEGEGSSVSRKETFRILKADLTAHNQAEEVVFYSRLISSKDSRVLALEGKCEHNLGSVLLDELSELNEESDEFAAKAKVLRSLIEHHIEVEEGAVHKQAKKELSTEQAEKIGDEFVALKEKLLANPTSASSASFRPQSAMTN